MKNLINKIFKKKDDKIDSLNPVGEPLLKIKMIYCSSNFKTVLYTFSDHYNSIAIEFLTACNQSKINVITENEPINISEDDKESDDFVIIPEKIPDKINYIIVSGEDKAYSEIFDNIANLQNPFIRVLIPYIYEYFDDSKFSIHINDGILDGGKFTNIKPENKDYEFSNGLIRKAMNIESVLNKMPTVFNTSKDIAIITLCSTPDNLCYNFIDIMKIIHCQFDYSSFETEEYTNIFKPVFNTTSMEDIISIIDLPRYALEDPDNNDTYILNYVGTNHNVADIFINPPEMFSGISDENITYDNVDEVIMDNENIK